MQYLELWDSNNARYVIERKNGKAYVSLDHPDSSLALDSGDIDGLIDALQKAKVGIEAFIEGASFAGRGSRV